MKKFLILGSLAAAVLFSACKKDNNDDNASGTITTKVDASGSSFNTAAKAIRFDQSGMYSVQIVGFQGASGSDQIALAITSTEAIAVGTYSESTSSTGKIASVNYVQQGGGFPYMSGLSTSNPATITVTSISASSIQGTFKGDLYLMSAGGPTTTKKVFTDGKFNVNF